MGCSQLAGADGVTGGRERYDEAAGEANGSAGRRKWAESTGRQDGEARRCDGRGCWDEVLIRNGLWQYSAKTRKGPKGRKGQLGLGWRSLAKGRDCCLLWRYAVHSTTEHGWRGCVGQRTLHSPPDRSHPNASVRDADQRGGDAEFSAPGWLCVLAFSGRWAATN